jgi:hypothetical protein
MLPPPTLRSGLLRDTRIETPSAIAAKSTSDAAATDAKMAMGGTDALDDDVEAVLGALVCPAFRSEPAASTAVSCLSLAAGVCVRRWRGATCFFFGWVTGAELVVAGGVEVVTGGGVDVVTGGGLLVVVGGGGVLVVGGGGGGGGVPATAADASASPAASATAHPVTDPMTRVPLNVPPASTACPGRPRPVVFTTSLAGWRLASSGKRRRAAHATTSPSSTSVSSADSWSCGPMITVSAQKNWRLSAS